MRRLIFRGNKAFTLIELLVVMTIIITLTAPFIMNEYNSYMRDRQRQFDLITLAKSLEQYKVQFSSLPCGSGGASHCAHDVPHPGYSGSVDQLYEVSCSDADPSYAGSFGNDLATERSMFVNGGQCCTDKDSDDVNVGLFHSFPDPTTTPTTSNTPGSCNPMDDPYSTNPEYLDADEGKICDDSAWGLYRWGYSKPNIQDPLNRIYKGLAYYYCYAVTGAGRNEYALFARMEKKNRNQQDGGVKSDWYEIYSAGYNKTSGWHPWLMGNEWL